MDNIGPPPAKRPRSIEFLKSQLEKEVRYFPINRKIPGIIRHEKSACLQAIQPMKGQNVVSSSSTILPYSSRMKFVPNKEANISYKLQKLKLKSPDGRDLGEINVQLLPHKGDAIGGKTIMLQKHSLFGKLDNQSTVSILKPFGKTKQITLSAPGSVNATGAQHSFFNSGSNTLAVNTIRTINTVRPKGNKTGLIVNEKQKSKVQHSPLILRSAEVAKCSPAPTLGGSKVFYVNVDKQTGLNTVQNINTESNNLASNHKIVVVHAENYPDSTEGKKNNDLETANKSCISLLSKDNISTELVSVTPNARTRPNLLWKSSQSSDNVKNSGIINSSKSTMLVSQSVDSELSKTPSKTGLQTTSTNLHKKQKSKLNSWTIVKTSGTKLANCRKHSNESDGKESPKDKVEVSSRIAQSQNMIVKNSNIENIHNVTSTTNNILQQVYNRQFEDNIVTNTQHGNSEVESHSDQNKRENIMVIVHSNMDALENSTNENEANIETLSMALDTDTVIDANVTHDGNVVIHDWNLTPIQSSKQLNMNTLAPSTVSAKQQDLDIIQKALSSCTDQELRNKALKALADCGIVGVTRDIPVPPKVTVSDSVTQTEIFSLLKPEMLVECSNTSTTLNQLNVIAGSEHSIHHPSDSVLMNEPQFVNSNNCYGLSFNSELSSDFFAMDDLILEHLSDDVKQGVNQVKDILSKPNPIVAQSIIQIQADLQAATTADANGMFGIHRAVVSGNITEVQRQLLVLKAVKQNIEITTGDGKTSLELAVFNDVDSRIVHLLLSAGAQPAFPIKLHESALIIACKTSSSILPELIKHVTPSSLLDFVDLEGFAPLHYCAQLGNMDGVKSLVSAGASVNLRDSKSGRTALFHALEARNIDMAWYLVDNGASPNIVNFAGQTPAPLVDEHRHHSLVEKFNEIVR